MKLFFIIKEVIVNIKLYNFVGYIIIIVGKYLIDSIINYFIKFFGTHYTLGNFPSMPSNDCAFDAVEAETF